MNEIQRAKIILKILNKTYPSIKVPLKSRNVFTLLISVLLSAQCTDVNVNNVTKSIYPKYHKPEHFVKLGRKKIETLIKKIGIFRIKAKSIYNLSRILVRDYKGKVPKTFDELEKLPKTFQLQWGKKDWTIDEVSNWVSKKFDWVFNSLNVDQVGTWEDSGCSCCSGGCACC